MKIGILTQPLHNNYGGLLQNFALQQVLKEIGVDSETIDHGTRREEWWKTLINIIYYLVWLILHPSRIKDNRYKPTDKEESIISRNTRRFVRNYIKTTKPFYSEKELRKIIEQGNYQGYVVGSDQCWRPTYSGGFLKEMFLSFADNDSKRVAYAASFGTDKWEFTPEMTTVCAKLAQKFDCITVREKSGVDLCRDFLCVNAIHVLDPTMLLSKEDYMFLVEKEQEPVSPGDLFYYILDPSAEKLNFIQNIAKAENIIPFTVLPRFQAENRKRRDVKKHIEDCVYPSVTSWLRGFMDAKIVVVDSFHGAVFSIIFNKPFWVISNTKRGNARFTSLLEMFQLDHRLVDSSELSQLDYSQAINWDVVNDILNMNKISSKQVLSFLK